MNFGILSTANIGRAAVVPAIEATEHEIGAVASRERDRAEHFAECVGSGTPDDPDRPRTDADEAVRNMAVVDALSESARRGEPVAVEAE